MTWVVAIPALPAATFLLFLVLSRSMRMRLLWLPVTVSFISLGLSLAAFVQVWPGGSEEAAWRGSMLFAVIGGHELELSMALDPIAAVTLLVVTVVACCVQVYSFGYMHGEKREGWYFGVLSLFTSAMLVLVLSSDLLLTFMAWEMMGLCSYLLIGFWFEQEAPRKASQKAFLTTRVGDMGFLLALFVIFATIGEFSYEEILGSLSGWPTTALAIAGGGLVLAAMGKSAQIPLHVWLPDAMAGPTPASALIHAATMVAAGIYVVARMLPLIALTPWVMTAVLYIGVATALMGSLLACVQHDVKKVLAYSTISQLGYMFIALGAGNAEVALFHLTTHAYFKSLLFLGAGVIIHAAHTQYMRLMGGLGPKMPYTAGAFTVGCLALAGIFPLSGFFSKDEIIAILLHEEHFAAAALALLASGLTAFYVARMLFRVFSGPAQSELHEGSPTMVGPLLVLAGITLVLGWASPAYANFLGGHGVLAGARGRAPLSRCGRRRFHGGLVGLRPLGRGCQHANLQGPLRRALRNPGAQVLLRYRVRNRHPAALLAHCRRPRSLRQEGARRRRQRGGLGVVEAFGARVARRRRGDRRARERHCTRRHLHDARARRVRSRRHRWGGRSARQLRQTRRSDTQDPHRERPDLRGRIRRGRHCSRVGVRPMRSEPRP